MECFVYKSRRKNELYLFVRKENDFEAVPPPLMHSFGVPEFVMRLELTPDRKLARSDTSEVIRNLSGQGFHLQLPPTDPVVALG
jgi:uncharacterized protein YcgL (UPF0745 family)